jgi:hypothetical protein
MTKPSHTTYDGKPENSGPCEVPPMRPGADEIEYRLATWEWLCWHKPDKQYGCTCKWPGIFFGDPTPPKTEEP